MSQHVIRKAVKGRQKLRMGLVGPTGSGKTWTALLFAQELVEGTNLRIGVIDSERESSELYADRFDFDVIQLTESHDPREYIEALKAFAATGQHGVVVVDSLSHAWMGRSGALEQVDRAAKRSQSGNSFAAWRDVTPLHNQLVDALLSQPYHLIATLRAKTEYVIQQVERNGRTVNEPRKIGMAPVQRDGMEYEFTVTCDLDVDHNLMVSKTRCHIVDGQVVNRPDGAFARTLREWIEAGVAKLEAPKATPEQLAALTKLIEEFANPPLQMVTADSRAVGKASKLLEEQGVTAERVDAAITHVQGLVKKYKPATAA